MQISVELLGDGNCNFVRCYIQRGGFQVSQICCLRSSCFDFIASKNRQNVMVKVSSEVDRFSLGESRELKVIADRLGAASVVSWSENS